jgi:MOSC domain-containing protein YiiM
MAVVVNLFVAPAAGAPMEAVAAVRAVPGLGLEGDRYFRQAGAFSRWPGPHRELTLIAEEDLDAFFRETGVMLLPEESRRNVLTRGVDLPSLVGRTFDAGAVRLRGMQRCQPCKYLARLTGKPVLPGLVGRGGIRARILGEGLLRVGDVIA